MRTTWEGKTCQKYHPEAISQEAGISLRTLVRLEKGEGVSLDSFIRVLQALKLEQSLKQILPDINVRPMDRISNLGRERRKARPKKSKSDHSAWIWGDEKEKPN